MLVATQCSPKGDFRFMEHERTQLESLKDKECDISQISQMISLPNPGLNIGRDTTLQPNEPLRQTTSAGRVLFSPVVNWWSCSHGWQDIHLHHWHLPPQEDNVERRSSLCATPRVQLMPSSTLSAWSRGRRRFVAPLSVGARGEICCWFVGQCVYENDLYMQNDIYIYSFKNTDTHTQIDSSIDPQKKGSKDECYEQPGFPRVALAEELGDGITAQEWQARRPSRLSCLNFRGIPDLFWTLPS